jgi:bifunctional UDP-N-acetylglucosamine pyrophosphorylase / glucosamine-1-phosphate N-acetyltransferase
MVSAEGRERDDSLSRSPSVAAIVLAAGDGKRLKSNLPKVLHPAAGRPIISHVLNALAPLPVSARVVVVSPKWEQVRDCLEADGFHDLHFAVQDSPRGTADATRVGIDALKLDVDVVLVIPGDTPLLESDTLFRLLETHRDSGAAATVLTAQVHDPSGYGRVVRDGDLIERIVEDHDATDAIRRIHEINGGVYVFERQGLSEVLSKVARDNSQSEYYLTDVVGLLGSVDKVVGAVRTDPEEVSGVNSRSQLAYVSGLLRHRVCEGFMAEGVSIVDPRTTYIDSTVVIERDATIHPFTFIEGDTHICEGAEVGPQTRIVDSWVGPGATVTFAVVRESSIGPEAVVGPFASLRPGNKLERGSKVGTFVEAKNSVIGEGSKVNHLSYVGDAEIGRRVNVGAGTVTCNWDGKEKHKTIIEDDAYISSDTMLVAPVRVGRRAATGAGAVVKDDVPDDALAVGVPARIIDKKGDRMGRRDQSDG